jgi:hypothetical protein
MSTGRPGRPKHSKTAERDIVDVPASRCNQCGSTRRSHYERVHRLEGSGNDPHGRPYSAVEMRSTRCLDCSQARIDRTWVYLPDEIGETD